MTTEYTNDEYCDMLLAHDVYGSQKVTLVGAIPLCYINIEVFILSKTQNLSSVNDKVID
jgi:hypothetical protein